MGTKRYETPPAFFQARWEIHRFNVDAAASDANALVRPHACHWTGDFWCLVCGWPAGRYYTAETDGLNPEHYKPGDRVWCNPPYDASIIRWVGMFRELAMDGGVMSELLLPASVDTRWFHRWLWNDEAGHWRDGVEGHFVGRIQFLLDGKPIVDARGKRVSSRQSNLLVTFKENPRP